jgi:hypothetical protein
VSRGADTDRLLELVGELGQRLSHAFRDVVPPEAEVHLLNAQRELLTALCLIYEHRMGRPAPPRRRPSRRTARRPGPPERRRIERIDVQ